MKAALRCSQAAACKASLHHDRPRGVQNHLRSLCPLAPISATKGAVLRLSEALRIEMAPLGVQVCVVSPGFINTHARENARVRPRQECGRAHCTQCAAQAACLCLPGRGGGQTPHAARLAAR